MTLDYDILTVENDLPELIRQVREQLALGWSLQGGMAVLRYTGVDKKGNTQEVRVYFQTLTRRGGGGSKRKS